MNSEEIRNSAKSTSTIISSASEAQFEAAMEYRAMRAARELMSFLDISFPRGKYYGNSLEHTMTICIKENMKGIHRD